MIYFLQRTDKLVKIGKTKRYHQRLYELTKIYGALNLLGLMDGFLEKEHELHIKFTAFNSGTDGREWFKPEPELLEFISLNAKKPTENELRLMRVATTPKYVGVSADTTRRLKGFAYNLDIRLDSVIDALLCSVGITPEMSGSAAFKIGETYEADFKAWKAQPAD